MSKICIVVPTYEEAENLPRLVEALEENLQNEVFTLLVVDDNSPDGTADIAEELNGNYGNIKVLKRLDKLGLGSAIRDGFNEAKAKVVTVLDADLQHPPELLPAMFQKIEEGHDLVVASRYVEGGGVEEWGPWRRLLSTGATMLAHLLLPKTRKVRDPMSGYFMIKKEVVDGVRLTTTSFKILAEILVKGKYSSVAEIPYTFKPRKIGKSKLSFKEVVNYAFLLLKLSGVCSVYEH